MAQKNNFKVVVSNPPWPGEGYGGRTNVRWPHRRGDKHLAFPIYLAYTNAILKEEGFDSIGIDAVEKEWGIFKFVEEMKKIKPNAILMEISTPSLMYDLETAFFLKKELPDCFIAVCGPHSTYAHQELIKNYNFIDAAIYGEFEITTKELCFFLYNKWELSRVNGISFKSNGKVKTTKPREFAENLDDWPFPDREDFKIENYQQAFYGGKKNATMIASKGCPYRCSFCVWPQTTGGHNHRTRSPKNIVDEIEFLIKNYNIDEVFFDDDTFAINKQRMKEISDEMIRRKVNISWLCMGRVDTVDKETAEIMKKAGCNQIFFGFESGSQDMLNSMKKGIKKSQMIQAVKDVQAVGMAATGSFMFGLPEETHETAKQTLEFAKELKSDFVQFTSAAPFPGTKYFETAKEEGLLGLDSWSDLDGTKGPIARTRKLSREDLRGIQRKAYISYYTSPGVILQNIKMCRSISDFRRIVTGAKSILARIIFYK